LSCDTACTLSLAWGVHLVLLVGVTVADVALAMVAGMARYVVWDGVVVAIAWGVHFVFLFGVAVADVELDVMAGVVGLVVWDILQGAARMACGVQLVSGLGYLPELVYMYWLLTWSSEESQIDQ